MSDNTVSRLLIANRGEIARRIIRTAHSMGISTIAVFADGDAAAPYVREADEAISLGGKTSRETYLDTNKLLAACRQAGANAVHPGYGFLSENASFAQAVQDAGLIWVGPPASAIAAMGDKLSARARMEESGVPTLPAAVLGSGDNFAEAAATVGYPLLVKASAGGGGKGMRVVERADDLAAAVEGARREAATAFGDDTVFLERWLPTCRHVEIQILADLHGHFVYCFERECSIQRRHQKIIEEAPSPALTEQLRERMGAAAIAAARAIDYSSAGTVEFLLSGDELWFLEVNTRLQVEHPVTEAITGLDLVREQLRIAQGEPLGWSQADLTIRGHAIEARVYAEDPENDFLPAPGKLVVWEPSQTAEARFDSGVESGSQVSLEFDPMLAKVIVHAPTRQEAALRLARVLETTRIQGVTTNRDFLVATLRHPAFLAGDTTTDFIDRVGPQRTRELEQTALIECAIAAAMAAQHRQRAHARVLNTIPSGWRNTTMPLETIIFRCRSQELAINYRRRRSGQFDVEVGSASHVVTLFGCGPSSIDISIDDRRSTTRVTKDGDRWLIHGKYGDVELEELPRFPSQETAVVAGGLVAPMPGNVIAIHVESGQRVGKGSLLVTLEAMKMENHVTAPHDGVVAAVQVGEGDQVANGELLIVLEDN